MNTRLGGSAGSVWPSEDRRVAVFPLFVVVDVTLMPPNPPRDQNNQSGNPSDGGENQHADSTSLAKLSPVSMDEHAP
jgi:hypothetical protein